MTLSKSDYMLFLKHPAWLWLKKHDKAKLPPVDANLQAMFDAGHAFEPYAEQLFLDGVRIGFNDYNEYLTLPARTQKALDGGATSIFQGRFEYEQLTFICDVISVVGDKEVDLYEIKSSTEAKLEHELDLAFQLVVLESCGFTVRKIAVIHVNRDYVRQGKVDAQALTKITDITDQVKVRRAQTKLSIDQALAVMRAKTRPDISPSLCQLGSLKDWLEIYRGLVAVESGSIYDLYTIKPEQIKALEQLGITKLVDIPDGFDLSEKERRQVTAVKRNEVTVEPDKIQKFLDKLVYPLYFLDYETLSSIVPYFDGTKPYQQIPFQYSLHILDTPTSELRHTEYLHRENSNPVKPLTEALNRDIGNTGTVLVWNAVFEKSCNDLMAQLDHHNLSFYHSLNERIVDLMLPYANGWHHHKDFKGSASIKNVLPVLAPELSYKSLAIQEGGAAQRLWMEAVLDGKRDEEKEQILSDLIKYCQLDTLAMVKIFNVLKHTNIFG